MTKERGPRIEAIMQPLRAVADEIVIAADARVGEEDLEAYARVADRVVRADFEFLEEHLAWLHEQCSGDWIFRLDGDEVPSPALVGALPELIVSRALRQYSFPRRWLAPDGEGWLDELPWAPDFQNRLVRNDADLSFSARLHTGANTVYPARFLDLPIYHLLCALEPREQRHVRTLLAYELTEPGRIAPGGGPFNATYYLPERFARRRPVALPERDRAAVRSALTCEPYGSPPRSSAEATSPARAETTINLLERDLRLYQCEQRGIFVEVVNGTDELWPGGLEQEPRVRLSYHLYSEDGSLLEFDGPRSPLPAPLPPGERAIVPVSILGAGESGRYLLEIDLVHEDVRWFGRAARAEIDVVPPGETERNVPRRRRLSGRRQIIPKIIHRVWVGDQPLPEEAEYLGTTWRRHHPSWDFRLWTDEDLASLSIAPEVSRRAQTPSELADVVRYHVVSAFGGVYVDTDFECLRPLDPLLGGVAAFAAFETPGVVSNAVLGAVPGHPALRLSAELSRLTVGKAPAPTSTGPPFFTHVLWDFPDVTLFPPELFYPYLWTEPERRHERFEGAYAAHHWAMAWRPSTSS